MSKTDPTTEEETELPKCGWCGEPLDSPAEALDHLSEEHGIGGTAAVDAVYDYEWPEDEDNE